MDSSRNSDRSAARLAITDGRQSDETDEWRRRMSPEMYTTLKAIQRNDAAVTELYTMSHYPYTDINGDGYSCLPLGPAFASNSHVTTLSMSLSHVYPTNSREQVWCTQVRQWIQRSTALRNVTMFFDNEDEQFSSSMFDNISRNPHLEVVRVVGAIRFGSVLRLLRSQTLRTLDFGDCTFHGMHPNNDRDRRVLAEALGANSRLQELIIQRDQFSLGFIIFESILTTLSQNPRLRVLQLNATTDDVDEPRPTFMIALRLFLGATSSLCHFSITFKFDNESINELLEGFRSCPTLNKATFHGCGFDSEAVESLVSYVRSSTAVPAIGMSEDQYHTDGEHNTWSWFMRDAVFPILTMSSLKVLELSNVLPSPQDDTSRELASHLANTRLHRLLVRLRPHDGVQMIANALPTIRHLRVLEIEIVLGVGGDVDSQIFIQGLRQNGSLHHFALRSCDDSRPFPEYSAESAFNAQDTELVRSICLRNQNLAELLRRPKLTVDPTPDTKTDVESFPDLFVAASEPTITGPNAVLVGLLALNDSLQRRDLPGKRKAANPT